MLIDINKIIVNDRIRKDFGNLEELAEDIKENGLINPPVVNKSYVLLAGERRLKACKLLGWPTIEVRMMDTRDAEHELNIEISENDVRKGFSKSERLDYIQRFYRIEQAKAKERQDLGLKSDKGSRADDATAKQFGIGRDTMRRELFISDNRDLLDPADFAEWDEGKLSTNKAFQRIKAAMAQAEKERDEARQEMQDVYLANENMEREVESLREQLAKRPKPEVIEREVEVEVESQEVEARHALLRNPAMRLQRGHGIHRSVGARGKRRQGRIQALPRHSPRGAREARKQVTRRPSRKESAMHPP